MAAPTPASQTLRVWRRAGVIGAVVMLGLVAGCGGGRAAAAWSSHDRAGWAQFCTARAHLPTSRCACYQRVFQNAGKTYSQIHKAVLNAPSLATSPPPQEAQVFRTAAAACP